MEGRMERDCLRRYIVGEEGRWVGEREGEIDIRRAREKKGM